MKEGDKVVALRDIPVIDPIEFIAQKAVSAGDLGTVYKIASKTLTNGTEIRAVCVNFDGVSFPVVLMWENINETIKLA